MPSSEPPKIPPGFENATEEQVSQFNGPLPDSFTPTNVPGGAFAPLRTLGGSEPGPKFVKMYSEGLTIYGITPDRKVFVEHNDGWFDCGITEDTLILNRSAEEIPVPPKYAVEPLPSKAVEPMHQYPRRFEQEGGNEQHWTKESESAPIMYHGENGTITMSGAKTVEELLSKSMGWGLRREVFTHHAQPSETVKAETQGDQWHAGSDYWRQAYGKLHTSVCQSEGRIAEMTEQLTNEAERMRPND